MPANTHEDRAREEKAKKLARRALWNVIALLKEGNESMWKNMAMYSGVPMPSEQTRRRVVEILEEITI